MGYLLDRLGLHISVANGCPWRGGADVGLPVGVDREESTGCGGHHGSAIQDGVGVVGRCVDGSGLGRVCVLRDCGWCCLDLGRMAMKYGCRGCDGEGVRSHTVGLKASRRSGPWPHLGNSAGGRCGRGTISDMVHLESYCTDCCRHGRSDVARELSVHRVRGNARIEGERWLVRCLRMKRCWYRWILAGWVGVCPFVLGNALCVVVCGVRSEYVDVVQVLVVMGWRCVVVRTEHVAGSRDAGVTESGLCVVVVTDLRRTAVAPLGCL